MKPVYGLAAITNGRTGRASSWDTTGRNMDCWTLKPGETAVLADIKGPGVITHLWMTQRAGYRDCLLRITWDDARSPSVLCPLGDFFGLGHGIVNSYQSALFTASTRENHAFDTGCALNCYVPMPFRKRAVVELINQAKTPQRQYFYVDYETVPDASALENLGYFHAEFRRALPFGGWGHDILVNSPPADVVNKERQAWKNNYVILETKGRGHYIGCNLSVTNFQGTWWGEGDDMIWVDGYKWPPDLHGTGSEDYLNQAWGMQQNAFLHNGSSIHEANTGGYQTSYVHHLENPVRFTRDVKVTIEHGHANHLANEMSSVAYWYAENPTRAVKPPPVSKRQRVPKDEDGRWSPGKSALCPGPAVAVTTEMRAARAAWRRKYAKAHAGVLKARVGRQFSPYVQDWHCTPLMAPVGRVTKARYLSLADPAGWENLDLRGEIHGLCRVRQAAADADGIVYFANRFLAPHDARWNVYLGHDGGARVFVDGTAVFCDPALQNPAYWSRSRIPLKLAQGEHEVVIAFDTAGGRGTSFFFCFEDPRAAKSGQPPVFPRVL